MSKDPEVYHATPEQLADVAKSYDTPIDLNDADSELHLVQLRAEALVKHVMRVRRKLEFRGVARSTAYWTAYAIGDSGIMPWAE